MATNESRRTAWQYRYHLITSYTHRTGSGQHLEWYGSGPQAIREWVDDGSFETRLAWQERTERKKGDHCDHLGAPLELTNQQGEVVWARQHTAWGKVWEERTEGARGHRRQPQNWSCH
ncbi:RHS domain-containing protein [Pseudomonas entomophila]|uniref:RHS domain-containing protein n=1 Tax=Pseudomonas entomophila TaxID=312306 RepID=UPI003D80A5BB